MIQINDMDSFQPHLGDSVMSVMDSLPGGCEFDIWFVSGVLSLLTIAEACEKSSQ